MKKFMLSIALLLAITLVACTATPEETAPTDLSTPISSSDTAEPTSLPTESIADTEDEITETETDAFREETENSTPSTTTDSDLQEEPETSSPDQQGITITEELQYRTNIFLSNFSEMWFNETYIWDEETQSRVSDFKPFVTDTADPDILLGFCWRNIYCNAYSEIQRFHHNSKYYYGIHIDTINYTCERYFGRTLSPEVLSSGGTDVYGNSRWLLLDEYVCTPAADGETYPNMTVADKIYDLNNGLYQVDFIIYTVDDVGGDGNIVEASGIIQDKSVYYFSADDADSHPAFSRHLIGTAVVKPYVTANGTETYQLVSYELFDKKYDNLSPSVPSFSTHGLQYLSVLLDYPESTPHTRYDGSTYYVDTEYTTYDIDKDGIAELIIKEDSHWYHIYTIDVIFVVESEVQYWTYADCLYAHEGNGIVVHDGGRGSLHLEHAMLFSLKENLLTYTRTIKSTENCSFDDLQTYLNSLKPINDFYPVTNLLPLCSVS